MPSQVIATCFALASFIAAAMIGVVTGNSILTILWRATAIMAAAWLVGLVIGAIAQHTVDDHLRQTAEADENSPQAQSSSPDQEKFALSPDSPRSSDDSSEVTDNAQHNPHDSTAPAAVGDPRREAA